MNVAYGQDRNNKIELCLVPKLKLELGRGVTSMEIFLDIVEGPDRCFSSFAGSIQISLSLGILLHHITIQYLIGALKSQHFEKSSDQEST